MIHIFGFIDLLAHVQQRFYMSNIPPQIPPSGDQPGANQGEQPNSPPQQFADHQQNENPFAGPQSNVQTGQKLDDGDATGGLIPYKNPQALIGYYLGYLGLLPILGIPFSIAAIILGFLGYSKSKKNPAVRGAGHAIFAITVGFLGLLFCGGGFGAFIVMGMMSAR